MPALPPIEALIAQLSARGITLPPGPVHADGYGDSAELSEELLALITSGHKRAGTGLLWAYQHDGEHIAQAGDIEIVVDHLHAPAMVTRIVSSEIVPYNEVTAEYAAIEGEGDGSLEYWRRAHWNFFSRECKRIGKEPTESMSVICSVFEVLHVLPPPSEAYPMRSSGLAFGKPLNAHVGRHHVAAPPQRTKGARNMSTANAQVTGETLQAFADAWNRHDVDSLMSFMTVDCVFEASAGSEVYGTRYVGFESVRAGFAEVWATFPDARWGNARHFVAGDRGVSEWTFTGTRADGTHVEVHGCDLFTFRDGKIALKNSYRKNRPPLVTQAR